MKMQRFIGRTELQLFGSVPGFYCEVLLKEDL